MTSPLACTPYPVRQPSSPCPHAFARLSFSASSFSCFSPGICFRSSRIRATPSDEIPAAELTPVTRASATADRPVLDKTQSAAIGGALDTVYAHTPSPPAGISPVPRRDLARDEAAGGHTLARHVGKTDAELRARLKAEPDISAASTYTDLETAERVVAEVLAKKAIRSRQVGGSRRRPPQPRPSPRSARNHRPLHRAG